MINLLIASDSMYDIKKLTDCISKISDKIRVCNITTNEIETLDILKNNKIDITLLNFKKTTNLENKIIEKIMTNETDKHRNSFIILTKNLHLMQKKFTNNEYVYKILPQNVDTYQLSLYIDNLVKKKEKTKNEIKIKKAIINELLYLGYDISHKGTRYLVDIVYMAYLYGEKIIKNLNKNVYPIIANKYNQSVNNIKCYILRETENMYYNCEENKLKKYLKHYNNEKPNIKTVIYTVYMNINNHSL